MIVKSFWRTKSFWFNLLALIVAVASNYGYTGEMPESWVVFIPVLVTLVNMLLHYINKNRGYVV